jgi:uncharacterized protein
MRFYRHIREAATVIVTLLKTGREASDVMAHVRRTDEEFAARVAAAGRNDPCPCGSGLKTKRCHGTERDLVARDLAAVPTGTPRPPISRR